MKTTFKIILLIMCLSFTLNGCMSTNNLNDLTVVQALGVDSCKGNTKVTIQYLDINKSGTGTDTLNGNITATAQGVSSNISDALSSAAKSLSHKIFMGQNKIIVFGSEYSNIGLDKGLDYLIRSIDSRPDVLVAMSSTSASDIINNEQNSSRIPAENIFKLLSLGEEKGLGAVVSVNDILNAYQDKTTDVYLPILNSSEEGVYCEGIACFANERTAVKLDEYQTNGFLFLKNRISGGTMLIENEEFGFIGVDIVKAKCHPNAKFTNNKLTFCCKIDVDILLNELEKGSTSDLTPQKIREVETLVENRIKDMAHSAFYTCMNANSDPFAIGKFLARDDVTKYNELKGNWHNYLDNAELELDVGVKLKNINDNSLKK